MKENNVFKRKNRCAPKYTVNQLKRIPKCCRALRLKHFAKEKFIILDDESYFTFSHQNLSGNDIFYTDNIDTTPDEVKYASEE